MIPSAYLGKFSSTCSASSAERGGCKVWDNLTHSITRDAWCYMTQGQMKLSSCYISILRSGSGGF